MITFDIRDNGNQIYYRWNWSDEISDWIGPYNSGNIAYASHSWNTENNYEIRVKSKDIYGRESGWSDPLEVSMPKNKQINLINIFLKTLFERFPILEFLLLT